MKQIVLLTLVIALVFSQAPIPSRPDGMRLGDPSKATIVFEAFVDLACDDSKDFWLGPFQEIYKYYFASNSNSTASAPGDVLFYLHQFPLPYHTSAFAMAQTEKIITDRAPTKVLDFVTHAFTNQSLISNIALANQTPTQLKDIIYTNFAKKYGIGYSDFIADISSYAYWNKARVSFKYACAHNIFGTPSFLVNGIQVFTEDYSFAYWKKLFDGLKN